MATSQQTMISHTFGVAMRTLSPMSNKERCSVSAPRSNCPRQISYARAQRFYGRMLRCVVGRVGIQDADSWRHFANEPLIFFHSFFFPFFPVKDRHGVTKLYKPKSVRQNCTYNPSGVNQEGTPPTTGHHSSLWIVLIRYAGILLSAGHRFWNVNLAEGLAVHPNVGTCWGDIFFWQIISSRTARRLHLSDPLYTSASFQLDWRYPHTSCQLPCHLVTYATSCPPQYGILEVIWRVESEKRNMRLQRPGPAWCKIQGADVLFIDVWQSSARRPCLNLFPRWNDVHFCFEVPSDAWCSEDGDEYNVGALISSWVCVFLLSHSLLCWVSLGAGWFCLPIPFYICGGCRADIHVTGLWMGSLKKRGLLICILHIERHCGMQHQKFNQRFIVPYFLPWKLFAPNLWTCVWNARKRRQNWKHFTFDHFPEKPWVSFLDRLFAFLSNLQGRECKKCNWKDAGMAWKAPSSLIGGSIWPRWGTSGYISCRVF